MSDVLPWFILAGPAVGALAITIFNVFNWPRGRVSASEADHVSVLIPARNEAGTIEAAVRSALAAGVGEVIVYDDQSTDETPTILARIRNEDDRLRVLNGVPLPAGWVGKPHACHRLSEAATGDLLLFLDADVELERDGVSRILTLLEDHDADAVTAVPRQLTGSFFERLILPLLHVSYVSWLPIPLIWRSSDPRFLAANGQVLAVHAPTYESVGGFEAVRDAVVDDMAFCRNLKQAGHRVVFADGHEIARCRMYESAAEVWTGFSKNIYEGIGSPTGLLFATALFIATFVAPWVALTIGIYVPSVFLPAVVGVAANVAQRGLLAVRHGHPPEGVLLAPVSVLALVMIAANSYAWHLRGDIRWSGRSYAQKEARRV